MDLKYEIKVIRPKVKPPGPEKETGNQECQPWFIYSLKQEFYSWLHFRHSTNILDLYDTGICVKTLALCDEKKLNIFPWNAILLGFLDSYWLMELKSFALSKTCTTFIIAHLHTHLHTHLNVRYQISDFYLTTGHCQILFDPFAMEKLCDVTKIINKSLK